MMFGRWIVRRAYSFKASSMYFKNMPFVLADIGEGITEVEIIQWHINEGSTVKQFDKLVEVQSDKAAVDITSKFDGRVVRIHYPKGAIAKVGTALIDIEVEDLEKNTVEQKPIFEKAPRDVEPAENKINLEQPKEGLGGIKMLPSVRKMMSQSKIDPAKLVATGPKGNVTREDVWKAMETKPEKIVKGSNYDEFTEVKLTMIQKAMAKSMERSLKIPHFVYGDNINVTGLQELRRMLQDHFTTTYGFRLTLMPFLLKAFSLTLLSHPTLNTQLDTENGSFRMFRDHNINIATDTPQGLLVPCLKCINTESVFGIANRLNEMVLKAKQNRLERRDLEGGTISFSNIGNIGGTHLSPVIQAPQVCIAAIGRERVMAVYENIKRPDIFRLEQQVPISVAADHRLIDGASVARFVADLKQLVENPGRLLSELK